MSFTPSMSLNSYENERKKRCEKLQGENKINALN